MASPWILFAFFKHRYHEKRGPWPGPRLTWELYYQYHVPEPEIAARDFSIPKGSAFGANRTNNVAIKHVTGILRPCSFHTT